MRIQKQKKWKFPLLCYAGFILAYLCYSAFTLATDTVNIREGKLVLQELQVSDFDLKNFAPRENSENTALYVSTYFDPQLHYNPKSPFYANRLTFDATPLNLPPSEMVLYYSTSVPGQYNERQKLWAEQNPDGSWYFNLGGKQIKSLRLDPDPKGGVLWEVRRIALNDPKPLADYFIPTSVDLFLLVVLPAMAAALLKEIPAIYKMVQLRKRIKK